MGGPRTLPKPPARSRRLKAVVRDGPGPHPVLAGAKEVFGQGQEIDQGFLKPSKRRLADLVVTRPMLDEGIALLDERFRRFEQKGHPVSLSPGDRIYCRVGVDVRENPGKTPEHRYPSLWAPSKPTVVFIGTVAIGLTLFALTETKEARRVDGKYLPLDQAERHRPRYGWPQWTWTAQHAFATGRFCLQAILPIRWPTGPKPGASASPATCENASTPSFAQRRPWWRNGWSRANLPSRSGAASKKRNGNVIWKSGSDNGASRPGRTPGTSFCRSLRAGAKRSVFIRSLQRQWRKRGSETMMRVMCFSSGWTALAH